MRIGILGATGPAGRGLAARLASVGHDVLFGSRSADKAEAAVAKLRERWGERIETLSPVDNAAATDAPIVVLAVTADAAIATIREHAGALRNKIVVSMANNLEKVDDEFKAVLPPHGSVAAEMQALAWDSRIVTAFHLVPASEFEALDRDMASDVVACGDDDDARRTLMEIIETIPNLRAFDGGSLDNAVGMETFAAVLLTINLRHRTKASLRFAGV